MSQRRELRPLGVLPQACRAAPAVEERRDRGDPRIVRPGAGPRRELEDEREVEPRVGGDEPGHDAGPDEPLDLRPSAHSSRVSRWRRRSRARARPPACAPLGVEDERGDRGLGRDAAAGRAGEAAVAGDVAGLARRDADRPRAVVEPLREEPLVGALGARVGRVAGRGQAAERQRRSGAASSCRRRSLRSAPERRRAGTSRRATGGRTRASASAATAGSVRSNPRWASPAEGPGERPEVAPSAPSVSGSGRRRPAPSPPQLGRAARRGRSPRGRRRARRAARSGRGGGATGDGSARSRRASASIMRAPLRGTAPWRCRPRATVLRRPACDDPAAVGPAARPQLHEPVAAREQQPGRAPRRGRCGRRRRAGRGPPASRATSLAWRPSVGSSRMNRVGVRVGFASSRPSRSRCASPPDRLWPGWPSRR